VAECVLGTDLRPSAAAARNKVMNLDRFDLA
jgi:hypothetical protein